MKWFKFLVVLLILNLSCDTIPFVSNYTTSDVSLFPIDTVEDGDTIWITDWIPSDSLNTFWFKISRTKQQVDNNYKYKYDVYFLSNNFILLENVVVSVNNVPLVNTIEESIFSDFTFQGDINKEVGDLKISFLFPLTDYPMIQVEWDNLTVY